MIQTVVSGRPYWFLIIYYFIFVILTGRKLIFLLLHITEFKKNYLRLSQNQCTVMVLQKGRPSARKLWGPLFSVSKQSDL